MLISIAILAVCLFLAFSLFFAMNKEKTKYSDLYPTVDCEEVDQLYPTEEELKKYALLQYELLEKHDEDGRGHHVNTNCIACFCEKEVEKYGWSHAYYGMYNSTDDEGR